MSRVCRTSACLIASALWAALLCIGAPPLTVVKDVVYKADGSRFGGVAQISCTSFIASDGSQIPQQTLNVTVTDGNLQAALTPTTNATPSTTYVVNFQVNGTTLFTEYWAVPQSSTPVGLTVVRVPAGTKVRFNQMEFGSESANRFLASPDGTAGALAFRGIVADDVPALPQSKITNLATDLGAKYGSGANASLSGVTVTPSTDAPAGAFRRFDVSQTAPVLGVQTESSSWVGYLDALGRLNVPGQSDGCATWSGGVLGSTGITCGAGGSGGGAGGAPNTVQLHGPGGVNTGYAEVTIDPITKQLSVPSIKTTGSGPGMIRLASGTEPTGQAGTTTLFSEPGELLSIKPGTGAKKSIVMMGGHLSGDQGNPSVSDFSLTDDGSLGKKALTFSTPNKSTTGTTQYLLAKIDASSNGQAVLATTADMRVPVWVVMSGAGISGSAELAEAGQGICVVDGAGGINQYLVASSITDGRCHPVVTPGSGDWVVGVLTNAPTAAGQQGQLKVLSFYWSTINSGGSSGPVYAPGTPINSSDLPAPTTTAAGAVLEITCPAGQFVTKVAGTSTCATPQALEDSDLPTPTTDAVGAVLEITCPAGQFVNKVAGTSTCAAPPSSGGSGSIPTTYWQSTTASAAPAASAPSSSNGCRVSSLYITQTVEFNSIVVLNTTADTNGNTYSWGLIGSDNSLSTYGGNARVAHTGAISGSTMVGSDTLVAGAMAEGTVTINPGWYAFAFCSSSTTGSAAIASDATSSNYSHLTRFPSVNVSAGATGGVLNSSIPLPSPSLSRSTRHRFWLVKQ